MVSTPVGALPGVSRLVIQDVRSDVEDISISVWFPTEDRSDSENTVADRSCSLHPWRYVIIQIEMSSDEASRMLSTLLFKIQLDQAFISCSSPVYLHLGHIYPRKFAVVIDPSIPVKPPLVSKEWSLEGNVCLSKSDASRPAMHRCVSVESNVFVISSVFGVQKSLRRDKDKGMAYQAAVPLWGNCSPQTLDSATAISLLNSEEKLNEKSSFSIFGVGEPTSISLTRLSNFLG